MAARVAKRLCLRSAHDGVLRDSPFGRSLSGSSARPVQTIDCITNYFTTIGRLRKPLFDERRQAAGVPAGQRKLVRIVPQ